MIVEARTRFEVGKVGTSSAPTGRQTRSAVVKEKPPPPKIQIRRKAKEIASKAPKATGKRKKEQAHRAIAEEETKETKYEGGNKELRESGKKSKVVGAPTVKTVKPQIESFEEEDIPEALIIEGELPDVFEIGEIFTQIEKESEGTTTSIPTVTVEEPMIPKDIPTSKGEEKKDTEVNAQMDDVQLIEPLKNEEDKKKEEAQEHKVTYRSLTSKKIVDDDEDDDTISIQGPINMDMLNPTELMEIASTMQFKAKKKMIRAKTTEAQTIQTIVEIFSILLLETGTDSLSTLLRNWTTWSHLQGRK
ncbi:uncharacterized protein LOC131858372 [Cryptomeria japonica]|uniref:uncharacterized protein LOC131858372 n=1 Tax=Cryptomeria japonica TaxID=3369 RepID=UPI0027DAA41C|nr:uncharacterized protein LOC131858372 [Cryptomeria japonica]